MGTSYTPPAVGSAGLVISPYSAYLAYLVGLYLQIYGLTVYLGPDSPDYQLLAILALQSSDLAEALQAVWLSFNPQTAIGVSLDLLGKLIGTSRNAASYSTVILTITGTSGTVITSGIALDTSGNSWLLPSSVTIPGGGSINVTATAQNIGNITANPGTITIISSPTAGWTGVTNPGAAIAGEPIEPDSSYRARLLLSQAKPSLSLVAGTAAAIAAVPEVTRSQVYENPYDYTASFGLINTSGTGFTIVDGYPIDSSDVSQTITIEGVAYEIATVTNGTTGTLSTSAGTQTGAIFFIGGTVSSQALGPAHSITSIVENGTTANIAQAIYNNKNPGVLTNGTTTVSVVDPNNGSIAIPISFDVLTYVQIYVALNVHALNGFTTATQAAIATDVAAYLDTLGIGESVVWSELFAAALNARPNPDQPLFSIRGITSGYESAQTTGTTSNGSPDVTLTSGSGTANGQVVVGNGIPANTTISSGGGTTSIVLSANATASASGVSLTFFTVGTSDIPVQYNQAAAGEAAYIVVNLV